ncbi:hypothetical protein Tco_0326691 [Tanacetum coccineum]
MLKVSPWKGVVRFGKRRKLSPCYIGSFKILSRVGPVTYKLELPRELQGIHNTFHVSNLKKCLSDEDLIIPLDEVRIDEKLHFIEELIEIIDREVKQHKQSRIPIVKVRWNSSRRPEYTWEREDQMSLKVDDDKETTELKSIMEVMPDEEEVALDAIPLAVKCPSIVDWKIHKKGKKSYNQIIRADRSLKMYLVFSHMLKSFNKEDLETLYKLVKTKYRSTRLVEDLELVLYGDLKTMLEPHVEDNVWKNQSDYRVLDWKLYDSCGVHSLRKQNVHIHMLAEKRYPLTAPTITDMLNKKLQCDHFSEMSYQFLKLLTK